MVFRGSRGSRRDNPPFLDLATVVPRSHLVRLKTSLGVDRMLADCIFEVRTALVDFLHRY